MKIGDFVRITGGAGKIKNLDAYHCFNVGDIVQIIDNDGDPICRRDDGKTQRVFKEDLIDLEHIINI
jgi:hypothetical protein